MDYVSLQVPEHLYLQTLAFLGAADTEHHASADLVNENEQLRAQVYDQNEELARLGSLLDGALANNNRRDERLQQQYDELARLYDAMLAKQGELDGDDSYPDHGPEDDAAAGMGLPGSVKASITQLRAAGLQIPDTWDSATQPIEVSYKGKVLGKMKVHLANKQQVQGDYQRLLRQAHAIDRREEAKVG